MSHRPGGTRPAKKAPQVIHNLRRCTTLQRAQTVPLGSCSAETPLLAAHRGRRSSSHNGGKTGWWRNVMETPRKPGAARWKSLFNYCRKQSGWQGHGLSVPPGSAKPSSALLSLQGAAQLGGTSSQEGPSSVKTAFPLAFAKPRPARR